MPHHHIMPVFGGSPPENDQAICCGSWGHLPFSDLDNRPSDGGHDDDWSGNVLPLTHGMHDGYYWKLMPDHMYTPREDYQGKIMRVRTFDIKPGKGD